MEKKEYKTPETEILDFGEADVITISGEGDELHELMGP